MLYLWLIGIPCADVSPPVQRSSHKRAQGHSGGEGEERSKSGTTGNEAGPSKSKRSKPFRSKGKWFLCHGV